MFACCIMFPTDRELAAGTSDIDLGDIPEGSFQGFPLRAARVVRRHRDPDEIASDLAACGFNAALLVGFCGANFTPEDVRSPRFRALASALHARGLSAGVCIPFADTVDNRLTRADPRMHQLRRDGKRPFVRFDPDLPRPPYPIYIIDYGSKPFLRFARAIVEAARDAGFDFIDYAEPDYWPTEDNGYGEYLSAAWRAATGSPVPHPSTLRHRLFMEDWHLEALRRISAHARRHGLGDHLTASPLGHLPYLVCQNYGKYSSTGITELSSTYHFLYGLGWKERLSRLYGIECAPHRVSGLGCLEARSMRKWEERHATYLVPGQSLPVSTFAAALDEQMLLHNMDVIFWEYPSIRQNYYETTDPALPPEEAWRALRDTFSERSRRYLSLPAAYHAAVPDPEALVFFSKRGVYADAEHDRATPCAYATALRLMRDAIQPFFLYAEDPAPLAARRYEPRILLVDEHHPVPPDFWGRVEAWLARGSRVVLYGGGPGLDWESGRRRESFAAELRRIFGVRAGRPRGRPVGDLFPSDTVFPKALRPPLFSTAPGTLIVSRAAGRPLAALRRMASGSCAVYVALPLCELPGSYLSQLAAWLLDRTGGRKVRIDAPLDIEHCLYRSPGRRWLAVKNHSTESRTSRFEVVTTWKPGRITELLSGVDVPLAGFRSGRATFADTPAAGSVRIYEISR
jgi:hypothetical protein